jgi:4-alpha-glucanotransferase
MNVLEALSDRCGIGRHYLDYRKDPVEISSSARMAVLAAMCGEFGCEQSANAALQALDAEALRPLPRTLLVRSDQPLSFELVLPAQAGVARLWIELEEGERIELSAPDLSMGRAETLAGVAVTRIPVELDHHCPHGYHRLYYLGDDPAQGCDCQLLVAPRTSWQPPLLAEGGSVYGVTVQLYTLRSERNWGMGDFTDLAELVRQSASQGVQVVGLNPLHALFPANPLHYSPYSPSNRAFLNVMYIDPQAVPGYVDCEAARSLVESGDFQARLAALRDAHFVDYQGVADCKLPVLETLYRHFVEQELTAATEAARAFEAWCERRGEALRLHATYDTLHEHFLRQDLQIWGWPVWPEEYRDPHSDAVSVFAAEHADRVRYHQFLQWCAFEQLRTAQSVARGCGMAVGIYLDLAVGIDLNGSQVWSNQSAFCLQASAGAPPDELARSGQDWGFPPLDPRDLQASAYRMFVEDLRANMSVCGAVRFDHAVSLLRLWWIPRPGGAANGAYVNYPLQDLLGVLALESERNHCLVIGEDLGTVPEELTEVMEQNHLFSYKVLYFEKVGDRMEAPADYPREAVAAVTTHDLPTLASWWDGSDIELRAELGLLGDGSVVEEMRAARRRDRQQLLDALVAAGCWQGERDAAALTEMTTEFSAAVHRFLASSRSAVMLVQLEDLMEMLSPVNVPGTFENHRNWQRKLRWSLEGLFERDSVKAICAAIREGRA